MEKNKQDYFFCGKRYLKDGKRLAIFSREIDGELEIFKLECSKHDQFSKEVAKENYKFYLHWSDPKNSGKPLDSLKSVFGTHPKIERIVIEEGDNSKFTFKKYCDLYFKKHKVTWQFDSKFTIECYYLEDNISRIPIGQPKWKKYGK